MFTSLEFFAGSGLVRLGLEPNFKTVWANDIDKAKQATYTANFQDGVFHSGSIEQYSGNQIPEANLAWASFPCQDLSVAGYMGGMSKGTRSGLFWEWIRILWELRALGRCPSVLVAENVVGFLMADKGTHFREAYTALRELGYKVGAVIVNANRFVPQSRARAFLIAVRDGVNISQYSQSLPSEPFHTRALVKAVRPIKDDGWVWWSLPETKAAIPTISSLVEQDADVHPPSKTSSLVNLLSSTHREKLDAALRSRLSFVGTAYRRTRFDDYGKSVQRLEVRFDGIAGCLRTPNGGSSRQTVLIVKNGELRTRLLTARECARLMGAPDHFKLPGSYNDAYRAMGDAVAVPVTRWLTEHLLAPLALVTSRTPSQERGEAEPWVLDSNTSLETRSELHV